MDLSYDGLKAEYASLWEKMTLLPEGKRLAEYQARIISKQRKVYSFVEERTKCPWYFVGILHLREAGVFDDEPNFHAWLYNGDPMRDHRLRPIRTVHVPIGLPPNPNCSWQVGACDAITRLFGAEFISSSPEYLAFAAEKFNGFGYRVFHHMRSPYLWGQTSVAEAGKYVRDREFDPSVMDSQLGTMATLKAILDGGMMK